MPTCKTCRWWGSDPETDLRDQLHVKVCCCPKIVFGVSNYDTDDPAPPVVSKADESHVVLGDEAAVMDGSGYFGQLLTGSDFGCVHHEEAK